MKKLDTFGIAIGLALALAACTPKPSEEQCRKAVDNVRALTSQSRTEGGMDAERAVRSCRARSSIETVTCQGNAKTIEELDACSKPAGKATAPKKPAAEPPAEPTAIPPAGEPANPPVTAPAGEAANPPATAPAAPP